MIQIFDTEVTAYDWLFVSKEVDTGVYHIFHNDSDGLRNFLWKETPNDLYCGFNCKHYDRYVVSAMVCDGSPETVKDVNDWIIVGGHEGWQYPDKAVVALKFPQFDLMDDTQAGTSLKGFEAHSFMNIVESSVSFDIDHALTPTELEEMIRYCKYDVDATEQLFHARKAYLNNKLTLGCKCGLDRLESLQKTNAQLTAAYLKAVPPKNPWKDERDYVIPDNLKVSLIPPEMLEFFDVLHDKNVLDAECFDRKLEIEIGGCPVTVGFGGIHGAIPCYTEEETETRKIINVDVASYYPHLLSINGYISRNIPNPKLYADTIETRIAAKKAGDTVTADALKLVLNTTYGAMRQGSDGGYCNPLYDPLGARSTCISGQLYLTELTCNLVEKCETVKPIQLNTDGLMISYDVQDSDKVAEIIEEWQKRTGFELETDYIRKIIQKDVNGYIEISRDGHYKIKGGMLVRGTSTAGAFKINNDACIIPKATIEALVHGTPVRETVEKETDIFQFQLIAKASGKYSYCFHMKNQAEVPVQRCNRVYASNEMTDGTLYKVHKETGRAAKMSGLPENCVIDNGNELSIADINKEWYIAQAEKQVAAFVGNGKKEKKMAEKAKEPVETKKTLGNVFERLLIARTEFLKSGCTRSGKNPMFHQTYFELDDIVPAANAAFQKARIVPVVEVTTETATMTIVNFDNPDETVEFSIPVMIGEPNRGQQPIQLVGSVITYARRYLYMLALDIAEADEIEQTGNGVPSQNAAKAVEKKKTVPVTPVKPEVREEVKAELTSPSTQADDALKAKLKEKLKKYQLSGKEGADEYVKSVRESTADLTNVTKEAAEVIKAELKARTKA